MSFESSVKNIFYNKNLGTQICCFHSVTLAMSITNTETLGRQDEAEEEELVLLDYLGP